MLDGHGEGDFSQAREVLERSLNIYKESYGLEHRTTTYVLTALGAVLFQLDDPGAVPLLEQALKVRESIEFDGIALATTRFSLAEALAETQRPRARTLAQQARDALAEAGEFVAKDVAEIDRWLATH